jgi:hypothetical protein
MTIVRSRKQKRGTTLEIGRRYVGRVVGDTFTPARGVRLSAEEVSALSAHLKLLGK